VDKLRISKKAIIATIVGAVVGLIFQAFIGSLLTIIVGAAIGLGVGIFMFPASGKRPQIEVVDTSDPTENHMNQLLSINKSIRLDPYLEEGILNKLESIIDKLGNIVPRINREHPGSELTFVSNRMITSYLPELLEPYLGLTPNAREGEKEKLLKTLGSLDAEIDNIINLVDQSKVNEFRVQDTFLRHKFQDKGVEA
jgi:hypothetical protein